MNEIEVECNCGSIQGRTMPVDADSGTRLICCCDDCQRYANYLNHENSVLDQYGGTEVFQMPVSFLQITKGTEKVACIRLSSKGLYRWYASCCCTPIGNTMGSKVPFIGLFLSFVKNAELSDSILGKSKGYIHTKYALQDVPNDLKGNTFKLIIRSLAKIMAWKVKGLSRPSAFFNDQGKPVATPKILNSKSD